MRPKGYPPGPRTIPVLGNLLQMPLKNFHLEFQKWAFEYGPIMSLKLGCQDMILINDPAVVKELIEKRSNIYSARPDLYIREFGNNLNIALRDNDEVWRRQRKMYHVRLNVQTANTYLPYQLFDSIQLLNDLLDDPGNWVGHFQRYSASIASTLLYGWRTPNTGTGYVKDLIEVRVQWMDITSVAVNLQPVDFYPILRPWYRIMPYWMSGYKRVLRDIQKLEDRLFFGLLRNAKDKIDQGKKYPSFIRDMLTDKDDDRLEERQIAHNAGHGFGAATDTQWNTMLGFQFQAMLLFPEVQAEAQRELDRVVGCSRMPTWDDRPNLAYIRGIVEETLRWAPSTLSGAVPHSVLRDDVYKGMLIPKGATVLMNVWSLNHNTFKNSRDFDPTRHDPESTLIESNAISADSTKRPHFTFGGGRRVCPGFHVAERGLFLALSRTLWGFNMTRVRDANGQLKPINRDAVTPGFIVRPESFECNFTPRDQQRVEVIRRCWEEAKSTLDADGNFNEEFFVSAFSKKERED
ncbi:uncharacterized protein A1O5_04341 [Cladophialophora psammophila CBS 110553]|uniref:Cytochrome P450 oxidoreductase n=1 Tax=Cladophialophora psammophila CBS 110553 TaxID=1182543 RepID=W9X3J1_9EURO|nr:uncharacterized protein A1O5_04341 [Cladophialophora psammophila CBS 110553]EXJ71840.1 hypothetical protein A1O5_04341 [Cladophialophora psammophila CBS 110553]